MRAELIARNVRWDSIMGNALRISRTRKWYWLFVGLLSLGLVMLLDIVTGREVSFSLFYLVPVAVVCLKVGGRSAVLLAGLSAAAWAQAEALSGYQHSHVAIPFWNATVRLLFFLIFTLLLQSLQRSVAQQRNLARTDTLTGAVNRRCFFELLGQELSRVQRYGGHFALVYFDLDHFKKVNDEMGHVVGDDVLKTIVNELSDKLRKTDTVARLGGDEFALLLPETPPHSAERLIAKLRLQLLDVMAERGWPVTLSIGLLNGDGQVRDEDWLVRRVDQLMYEVKRNGRNSLRVANTSDIAPPQSDPLYPRRVA